MTARCRQRSARKPKGSNDARGAEIVGCATVLPARLRLRSSCDPAQANVEYFCGSVARGRRVGAATQVGWVLIEVGADRRVRAWSRHGTSLTGRLGALIAAFADTPASSVFDGELVAIAERGGRPIQDFAMVARAVMRGDIAADEHLRFVRFDLLALAGEDLRGRPWRERDQRLAEALPACRLVRRVESRPATPTVHAAIVELGFEGTVLKRPSSLYRPGRHGVWRKHKARHTVEGVLLAVRQDQTGTGTACAMSVAAGWWRSPAPAPLIRSASSSAWSTRGSTPTVTCARSVSLPVSAPAQPHEQPTYLSRCPGLAARQRIDPRTVLIARFRAAGPRRQRRRRCRRFTATAAGDWIRR